MKPLLSFAFVFLFIACSPKNKSLDMAVLNDLSGTINYRARIALPPGAVIDVKLQDVSRADAPATVLAEQQIVTQGEQVPIPFRLEYNPADIQPGHRYSVGVRIEIDGKLRWITQTMHPVINDGPAEAVEVWVEQVQ